MAPAGLASLERVLKAYAAVDPEVNYCQARQGPPSLLDNLPAALRRQGQAHSKKLGCTTPSSAWTSSRDCCDARDGLLRPLCIARNGEYDLESGPKQRQAKQGLVP